MTESQSLRLRYAEVNPSLDLRRRDFLIIALIISYNERSSGVTRSAKNLAMQNKPLDWSLKILAILLGAFFMVFGEFDDSPGLQGIGLILITSIVISIFRARKTNNNLK